MLNQGRLLLTPHTRDDVSHTDLRAPDLTFESRCRPRSHHLIRVSHVSQKAHFGSARFTQCFETARHHFKEITGKNEEVFVFALRKWENQFNFYTYPMTYITFRCIFFMHGCVLIQSLCVEEVFHKKSLESHHMNFDNIARYNTETLANRKPTWPQVQVADAPFLSCLASKKKQRPFFTVSTLKRRLAQKLLPLS